MSTTPQTDERRATIATLKLEAKRLVDRPLDPSMKELVRLAVRDFDEAITWLRQENVENRPYILKITDLAISFGRQRLEMVHEGIRMWSKK